MGNSHAYAPRRPPSRTGQPPVDSRLGPALSPELAERLQWRWLMLELDVWNLYGGRSYEDEPRANRAVQSFGVRL